MRGARVRAASALLLVLAACGGDSTSPAANDGDAARADVAPLDLAADREALSGRWKRARWASDEEALDLLESIGYASGSREAEERSGVTIHDRDAVWSGLNLLVSGHAPEALLLDMDGRVLHRWHCDFETALSDTRVASMEREIYHDFWRRAALFENGDLLAIFEGHALIKLDADSRLLWVWKDRAHHDLEVDARGHVWVLTRKAGILPRINPDEPVLEDFVAELDAEGHELRRVSVLAAFEDSDYSAMIDDMPREGDVLHTNTLELVDARLADRLPGVSVGDVLVSCLFTNTIAVLSMESGKVVWAQRGTFRWQHQPTVLDDGNLLLFDNKGGHPALGRSRVIELDPVTGNFVWLYAGTRDDILSTDTCGSCQRLPNGNTLITESDNGRVLEVTAEGRVVWEFLNPFRAGEHGELVATVFEMIRLDPDFPTDWIDDD